MQILITPLDRYIAASIGLSIMDALVRFNSLLTLARAAVCRRRSDLDYIR